MSTPVSSTQRIISIDCASIVEPPICDGAVSIDCESMIVSRRAHGSPEPVGSAGAADFGPDFGAAVRAHRVRLGLSLNQLAHRAGVDPAYIHRIESRVIERPPLPRRAVVLNIAAALE